MEFGLPGNLAFILQTGTYEEVIDDFPELLEEMREDEFQNFLFERFIFAHGQHDVRFIYTPVDRMSKIVKLRTEHYKRVIFLYEQYQQVTGKITQIMYSSRVYKNTVRPSAIDYRLYFKEDKKKHKRI
ncbi:MAG: hypothetical protein HQM14_05875 [SAR324 cluster bacterium]|nr:hypothetical protein [SAR324 cluster bacterium]